LAATASNQRTSGRGRAGAAAILVTTVLAIGAPTRAHDTKIVGHLRVTMGWADEPAFTSAHNAVVVALADAAGPLKEPSASLVVEVSFGDQRITLPLEPIAGTPHELRARIVPTRAGSYTFHVTGKVKGQAVDVTSACSERTFPCVIDPASIQFPVKDPPAGQLADAVGRALPRADLAAAGAARASAVSMTAIGVALLALAGAIAALVQRRRGRA
jgi:hypothetical protein